MGRCGGRWSGQLIYIVEDVSKLLDIVEEVKPLGSHMWAIVAEQFGNGQ